jgi:hypothetical protein
VAKDDVVLNGGDRRSRLLKKRLRDVRNNRRVLVINVAQQMEALTFSMQFIQKSGVET